MKLALLVVLACLTAPAQVQVAGGASVSGQAAVGYADTTPAITNVAASPDANTVVVTWTTQTITPSTLACGTVSGTYGIAGVSESGSGFLHTATCKGLTPSTTYYFQITAANTAGSVTATGQSATTALPATTPITGLSLGTVSMYNTVSSPLSMGGDTYYNCHSNDALSYLITNDTLGWAATSWSKSSGNLGSNMMLARFTAELPFTGQNVNTLFAFGQEASTNGTDARSPKAIGLFCMAGNILMFSGRQLNTGGISVFPQSAGTVMWSPDHGVTWNNYQNPTTFLPAGALLSPTTTSMFAQTPSTWGSATFVMYCGDDGTQGTLSACNREDNANTYLYAMANDGYWNNGNSIYLMRVLRSQVLRLCNGNCSTNPDWQCFTGGDGSVDANWSTNFASCSAVVTNTGELSAPNVQFVPALDRYLMLSYYYPNGANSLANANSVTWLSYEAPHPWGPWTLISTIAWTSASSPPGAYNPVVLNDTVWTGTTPTILFTGNFYNQSGYPASGFLYSMYYATLTVNH
jgi:hypothetical protein